MTDVAVQLPTGWQRVAFDVVDSTNEDARRRIEKGLAQPGLITARTQTAGRGRRGRTWQSSPGNILATLMEPLMESPQAAGRWGFVLSLAIAEAVTAAVGAGVAVKWPNDVLLGGAKLSGILLEIAIAPDGQRWLVSGFGVNVAHAPEGTPYPATCVNAYATVDAETLLASIATHYFHWSDVYRTQGFAPVRIAWLARAAGVGQSITVSMPDGSQLKGVFTNLSESGSLILTVDGQPREIHAGDVYFGGGK